jgi:hypothetical protein
MITTMKELGDHFCALHDGDDPADLELVNRRLDRRIYKDTAAGCPSSVQIENGRIVFRVFPYVEGFDEDLSHEGQTVVLPAEEEVLDQAVHEADEISTVWWNRTHGCDKCWDGRTVQNYWGGDAGPEDWGVRPVDPNCKECEGGGAII